MDDIVARLRRIGPDVYGPAAVLAATQAADEIERLRGQSPPTLTDAEREAVERLCDAASDMIADDKRAGGVHWQADMNALSVVRGLLERTKWP